MSDKAKLAYTLSEAGDAIGRTSKFVSQLIHAGKLRAKLQGREYLIPAKALQAWIDSLPDA